MRRALWVDDDQRLLTPAAIALGAAGIEIVFASDLAMALDRLKSEQWDYVIVDIGIDPGALTVRHPEALEALGYEQETTGLDFARYLLEAPAPIKRDATSIIICSGFKLAYLQSVAPELMARFAFVSKDARAFRENQFIADLSTALGFSEPVEAPPLAVATLELPYIDLYHDLKIAVRSSIPALARVQERLLEFSGGKQADLEAALEKVEERGTTLVDEAFSARGVNAAHLGAIEDILAILAEKRADIEPTGYAELTQLTDRLMLKVARLPKLHSVVALGEACRILQTRLCAIEIKKVTQRLLSEFSTPQLDASTDAFSFDSSSILSNILDIEEPNAMASRAQFERHIAPNVVLRTIQADQAHRFRRALTNIIDNAVKFQGRLRDRSTWIIVKHFADRGWCVTSIENWGAPIRPEELNAIFARGRRGEMARKQGNGQGLAIASDCVHALGGSITSESRESWGGNAINTFTVRLPLTPRLAE